MVGRVEDLVRVKNVILQVARAIQENFPEVADYFRNGDSYRVIAAQRLPSDAERFARLGSNVESILMSGARLALCGSNKIKGLMPKEEFEVCALRNHLTGRERGARNSYAKGKGFSSEECKRAATKERGQRSWETSEKAIALDLYLQGKSFAYIGREVGRTRDGVVSYFRKNAGRILASGVLYIAQYNNDARDFLATR